MIEFVQYLILFYIVVIAIDCILLFLTLERDD